jgi:hypothetical protein
VTQSPLRISEHRGPVSSEFLAEFLPKFPLHRHNTIKHTTVQWTFTHLSTRRIFSQPRGWSSSSQVAVVVRCSTKATPPRPSPPFSNPRRHWSRYRFSAAPEWRVQDLHYRPPSQRPRRCHQNARILALRSEDLDACSLGDICRRDKPRLYAGSRSAHREGDGSCRRPD